MTKFNNKSNTNCYYWQYIHKYIYCHWSQLDIPFDKLPINRKHGKGHETTYNNLIIMGDTETSKEKPNPTYTEPTKDGKRVIYTPVRNYVVAWTVSVRCYGTNIFTVYGHKPTTMIEFISNFISKCGGMETTIFFHNLAYDWVFLRKFMLGEWGLPKTQINTKAHYPISIKFDNGVILRDSLILAQRKLEKWAKDLDVPHKKAVGKWDYDKIRNQSDPFTDDELQYIEQDTLSGVECIDYTMQALNKSITTLPLTATGIPRTEVKSSSSSSRAKEKFLKQVGDLDFQHILEKSYHGGFTHGNRHLIGERIDKEFIAECFPDCETVVKGADFSSSYPFVLLSEKYPSSKFSMLEGKHKPEFILENNDKYAFVFKLVMIKPKLKDWALPMPPLQYSKCEQVINPVLDNGRILYADYVEIWLTDPDLEVINRFYKPEKAVCISVYCADKDYLPRWFTDYIYKGYEAKTKLKGGDPVQYSIAKSKVNCLYGMTVQLPVKPEVIEDYATGAYSEPDNSDLTDDDIRQLDLEAYEKYLNNRNKILLYQWGVWCTSYAFRNLFTLGDCFKVWVYSDTDSCYGIGLNMDKMNKYNDCCKEKLRANGYGAVMHNNREYWLGIAEHDPKADVYTEFKIMGAKRYIGRCKEDGELHLTVAGVPKSGVKCLNNDINNFKRGFVFDGLTTGKKTHFYNFEQDIFTLNDIIYGDSIDLTPCDYKLDDTHIIGDWEQYFKEEIEVQVYDE